jgi:hypothetical protein
VAVESVAGEQERPGPVAPVPNAPSRAVKPSPSLRDQLEDAFKQLGHIEEALRARGVLSIGWADTLSGVGWGIGALVAAVVVSFVALRGFRTKPPP